MTNITLLSALTALLILPSLASAAMTADLDPASQTNGTGNWTNEITLTTPAAGGASQNEQTLEINITSGTAFMMQYRILKTNASGIWQYADSETLFFGGNTISVPATNGWADPDQGRTVTVQFSLGNIGFDSLTLNGANANPDEVDGSPGSGQPFSGSEFFEATTNATWVTVLPLTAPNDGAASQGEQTVVINVTYIPESVSEIQYQVYKTTEGGGNDFGTPLPLEVGELSIVVDPVTFTDPTEGRAIKLRFTNDAVEFDALSVNGVDQLSPPLAEAEGTQGAENSQSISESSDIFDTTTNPTWVRNAALTIPGDGVAVSAQEQTLVMNVTYIPEGGANYRVYRTLASGTSNAYFGPTTALTLGLNTINVVAATPEPYNRAVKIQFDNVDTEFDALSFNGVNQLEATPAQGTQGEGNSQPISDFSNIITENYNGSYFVAAMTTPDDGAASQAEQTAVINVTYIPEGGATWRSNSTNAGGNYNAANEGSLALGPNTITVAAVAFDRTVNIQFSSDAIEFDALTFNGENPLVTTPGTGTQGAENSQSISESAPIFVATTNATWVTVTTMTTTGSDGSSQGTQTLEMNVTYIPGSGAQMRSYNTNEISGGTFSGAQTLTLGVNTITVPAAVGWANPNKGRATKIQFTSADVEFDALTFNGVNQLFPAEGTPGTGNPISDFSNIITENYNATLYVATMANLDDGATSQGEQTAVINVTYIPEGGATWDSNSTNELGNYITGATQYLQIGLNTITVSAVDYDRIVKIRFSSDAIEFDTLTFNGVDPLAVDDGGEKVTIANSNLFNAGPDATWVAVLTTAVSQDGASSQSDQTVVMYVTSLPESGANYRIYRTTANGGSYFVPETGQPATALGLGVNTISIPVAAFDRTVKVQFSSNAVEYNALSIGDVARTIGADEVSVPSVSIDGNTLSWTQTDGTTLQFSDDLESWTSLPSATSPYSPSTTPDRFYRTISEEEEE